MKRRAFTAILAAEILFFAATPAICSTILVTDKAGINDEGLLSWSALGASGSLVPNPFTVEVPGIAGLTLTGSEGDHLFERWDEGSVGWQGNFTDGEPLLFTGLNYEPTAAYGPMDFTFNFGISGFGTQIQQEFFGPFVAQIFAYNAADQLLGTYSVNGVADDGISVAPFIGIRSDAADIRRVRLSIPIATNEAFNRTESFAINSPVIEATPAPEPAAQPAGAAPAIREEPAPHAGCPPG